MARKKKKKLTGLQALVVILVVAGVLAYNNGYLNFLKPGTDGANNSVLLAGGKSVEASQEAKNCGFDEYVWEGYKPEHVEMTGCLLDSLKVNDSPTNTPKYSREAHFGPSWSYDYNESNCDTRNDILKESLTMADTRGCIVYRGVYGYDPYTGNTDVVWDKSHASSLQVDHIVALKNAWISGANSFNTDDPVGKGIASDPYERRNQVANDPLNLVLADGTENQSKSDKDASDWIVPENKEYRCEYVMRQVLVKDKYSLTVTKSEKKAIKNQLNICK